MVKKHAFCWEKTIYLFLILFVSLILAVCDKNDTVRDLPGQPDENVRITNDQARTEIFRDAGLGLFLHWGFNSQIGSEISWPLNNADPEFVEKYYALADTFDPDRFSASEWARLAKLAGMEYVVFTAKHHDGFCMFDTAVSDLKVTNSPYGRDILAEVVAAFRRQGLLIGIYYSPGDYRYFYETDQEMPGLMLPDFANEAPFGPQKLGFLDYEQAHVRELLTGYGDVFMLWFDGQCEPLKKYAWGLKPDLFIGRGEIPTPEQTVPGEASDHAWESCMTTSWQWSYQPNAEILPVLDIIWNLIQIRSRGGNMLLNIGPRPDGRIAAPDEEILRELGLWMMMYGEAVRGIRPWHITNEDDIWFTFRKENQTVYAFVMLDHDLEEPAARVFSGLDFTLRSVQTSESTRISLLGQAGDLEWIQDKDGLHITARNQHTVQMLRRMKSSNNSSARAWTWGPKWPVAIKITAVQPANSFDE